MSRRARFLVAAFFCAAACATSRPERISDIPPVDPKKIAEKCEEKTQAGISAYQGLLSTALPAARKEATTDKAEGRIKAEDEPAYEEFMRPGGFMDRVEAMAKRFLAEAQTAVEDGSVKDQSSAWCTTHLPGHMDSLRTEMQDMVRKFPFLDEEPPAENKQQTPAE